jgi:hypothetical protein
MIIMYNLYAFMIKYGLSEKQIGTGVNTTCQENLTSCYFGHACHRLVIPGLQYFSKGRKKEGKKYIDTKNAGKKRRGKGLN